MKVTRTRHVAGPNVYIYKPVLVARVELGPFTERESTDFEGFSDRLLRLLPGLCEHHCAKGEPGGFVERLYGGTYFGHIAEHVAIELACCLGLDVHYGKTLYAGAPGRYDIVMECKAYECQKFLLTDAISLVQALLSGKSWSVDETLRKASQIWSESALGPSTQAIVDAAVRRGIPVRRLNNKSLIQLGYGTERKLVEATITEQTPAVAVDIACDKAVTKELLEDAGIPVPEGGTAKSEEEAIEWLHRLGAPVVVKPYNGNQGRGVSLSLTTEEEVVRAFHAALAYSPSVMVERYEAGRNVRILIVNGKFVAASERIPAHVCGDGRRSVAELVDAANADPLRGEDHERPLTRIPLDQTAHTHLKRQGLTLSHVPALGEIVYLRDSANLSTGGEAVDLTDELHPSYIRLAERAARLVGLDVCGLDMVVASPTEAYRRGACTVIEVNASPGIRMHQYPSYGQSRNVADAIVASLFPSGRGRIPIVSVTGTNGKTTTTRLIGHGVRQTGKVVGMTTTGGVYIGSEQVLWGDTTGPDSARVVLSDPSVQVAVLETARGGIVRGGLAYDKANIAVLTNIAVDHIGQDGVESIEDLVHIKSLVAECVEEDGTVVLNADNEHLVSLAGRLPGRVVYFAVSDESKTLRRHLVCGGVGYYVSRGWVMEARGSLTWEVVPVAEVPLTQGGAAQFQVENCLAALAALRAYGLTRQQCAEALCSFSPQQNNPGRCSIFRMPSGGRVVLDYGHNPEGFHQVGRWLKAVPHGRLIGVVGVPGDRADSVIRASGQQLAEIFDEFILKEDEDKRGRREGEVAAILMSQLTCICPEKPCTVVLSEPLALERAIDRLGPDDIALVFFEHYEGVQEVVQRRGGKPVTELTSAKEQVRIAMV